MGLLAAALPLQAQPGPMLFDFENGFAVSSVQTWGLAPSLETSEGNTRLVLKPAAGSGWKGATLTLPAKDLSGSLGVAMVLRNRSAVGYTVHGRIDDTDHSYPYSQGAVWLAPDAVDTLFVHIHRQHPPAYLGTLLGKMRGLPGGFTDHWEVIDPARVDQVMLSLVDPEAGLAFSVDDIRAWGAVAPPTEEQLRGGYLPLLDSLGQFRHGTWPGKAATAADLRAQASAEAAELAAHPGPADWNAYGGWTGGPALEATGRFRTAKVEGRWWLVTPDGRLFWSHGINCVNHWETTPTAGRENLFSSIPPSADFRGANAQRKHGNGWSAKANALAHQRLRSWGVNTIGNWSDKAIQESSRTAYTANFATGAANPLPAALDTAAFRSETRRQLTALKPRIGTDPWCLGVFSDNEPTWPAATAAAVAGDYYRIVSEEMKSVLPGVLYLGSRLHSAPEAVWRAAGRFCDIISMNQYEYHLGGMPVPADVDKPVMLTEFHFGAMDRGLPHPGLRALLNQRQRAFAYADMVGQCLMHPKLVGAHWFQYGDQLYTGRSDGENYQIGFIDIADRPYPEMTAMARNLGSQLYAARSGGRRPGTALGFPRFARGPAPGPHGWGSHSTSAAVAAVDPLGRLLPALVDHGAVGADGTLGADSARGDRGSRGTGRASGAVRLALPRRLQFLEAPR